MSADAVYFEMLCEDEAEDGEILEDSEDGEVLEELDLEVSAL